MEYGLFTSGSFYFAHVWFTKTACLLPLEEQGVKAVSVSVGMDLDW